jgi:hypothetical protein
MTWEAKYPLDWAINNAPPRELLRDSPLRRESRDCALCRDSKALRFRSSRSFTCWVNKLSCSPEFAAPLIPANGSVLANIYPYFTKREQILQSVCMYFVEANNVGRKMEKLLNMMNTILNMMNTKTSFYSIW